MKEDSLGDRIKNSESENTKHLFDSELPLYARMDGRAFHSFCKGLQKPFHLPLVSCMQEVTKCLVERLNADLGYCQSDEISLGWIKASKAPFDCKVYKLQSILASMTSSQFVLECLKSDCDLLNDKVKKCPTFDSRVFQVPDLMELANCFIWRELDAIRNSVSMIAQANFSHKQLQGKSSSDMKEMLLHEKGIDYDTYDDSLKRGSYFKRVLYLKKLSREELNKIPEDKRPENKEAIRSCVAQISLPIMSKEKNKVELFFNERKLF